MTNNYEYIGFMYTIEEGPQGFLVATPHYGQHPAASKQKHRMAAVECYKETFPQNNIKEMFPQNNIKEMFPQKDMKNDKDV